MELNFVTFTAFRKDLYHYYLFIKIEAHSTIFKQYISLMP